MKRFERLRTWVFDLDHTLYPPAMRLFDQIEVKMTDFVMRTAGVARAEADSLRHTWWMEHGTTLAGLMHHHDIDADAYLHEVHDISFDALAPDPHLAELIAQLPGRKIVYTNGSAPYAAQVLKARGLEDAFDAIYGVEHAGYVPKPLPEAFDAVFALDRLDPSSAVMFEDDPRNLKVPHALGMATVHVAPEPAPAEHIHHHTDDLNSFLSGVLKYTSR
ncbi:pyrimidine 5'-nucleotidase [Sagittula sp. S175]|uniref:pyrimidine 5'-nucleotidase n=1 Tax=Sagittula sp. S175 TaxID=3415129 RepID=UPI003C7A9DC1